MIEATPTITQVLSHTPEWEALIRYAEGCPWVAGPRLASLMRQGAFQDWERVFAASLDGSVIGFCTLTQSDGFENCPYSPFVGFVFVDEGHRGRRWSQQLIQAALDHAAGLGYDELFVASTHQGLYEKFGFKPFAAAKDIWGNLETLFRRSIHS